jgi:hypothetical protein
MTSGRDKTAKRLGTDRRWTLLFIGDHGNVIALKRFKVMVMVTAFVFFSAICALVFLIFVNVDTISKNKELQKILENSKNQIESLRHEKEVLMARLVIAESNMRKNSVPSGQGEEEINTPNPISPKPETTSKEPTEKADQKSLPVQDVAQPKPAVAETDEPDPVLSVAVENFSIGYEPDSDNLNAQFKIKNTSPESQPISGHTVVVLKGDDLPTNEWLVMPAVAMVGDTPSGKQGKTFMIRRFRTMKFSFKTPENFEEFQTAVVYVFLRSGELLLEEDFAVTLPAPPAPANQEPSSNKTSSGNLPAKTPSVQTPSSDDAAIHMFF